jgi:hypothetical protein
LALHVLCPHCHKASTLDGNPADQQVPCPHCRRPFAVRTRSPLPTAWPAPPDPSLSDTPAPAAALLVPEAAPDWRHVPPPGGEPQRPLTLKGGPPLAWLDRLLPVRPIPFVIVIFAISASFWVLGYLLAADKEKFFSVREWTAQLLYLPAHLIALRLFVNAYTRNFLNGARHMTIPHAKAERRMRFILGPFGLLALLVAAPLCLRDLGELEGPKYWDSLVGPVTVDDQPAADVPPDKLTPGRETEVAVGGVAAASVAYNREGRADLLMWGVWCVEWFINAYIWVLILGFLLITMRTLRGYTFRDPVEIVLHEKHYRPFLTMSGQAASIVLGFSVVTALYVWYAEGSITDYIGLGVTVGLLLLGFGPPWMQIKSTVERVVQGEIFKLREGLIAAHKRRLEPAPPAEGSAEALARRLDEALLMLRIDYLDRLHRELGKNEAGILLLKLLAPVATILFKLRSMLGLPF